MHNDEDGNAQLTQHSNPRNSQRSRDVVFSQNLSQSQQLLSSQHLDDEPTYWSGAVGGSRLQSSPSLFSQAISQPQQNAIIANMYGYNFPQPIPIILPDNNTNKTPTPKSVNELIEKYRALDGSDEIQGLMTFTLAKKGPNIISPEWQYILESKLNRILAINKNH